MTTGCLTAAGACSVIRQDSPCRIQSSICSSLSGLEAGKLLCQQDHGDADPSSDSPSDVEPDVPVKSEDKVEVPHLPMSPTEDDSLYSEASVNPDAWTSAPLSSREELGLAAGGVLLAVLIACLSMLVYLGCKKYIDRRLLRLTSVNAKKTALDAVGSLRGLWRGAVEGRQRQILLKSLRKCDLLAEKKAHSDYLVREHKELIASFESKLFRYE